MCLAIYKPGDVCIPSISLVNGFQHNSDGAGYAYVKGGKVVIVKGLMTLRDFLGSYDDAFAENPQSPFLVHFRIRTMGNRSEENTHPFRLAGGGALIHNGGLDGTGAKYDVGKSDTALFVEKFGQYLTYKNVSKYKEDLNKATSWNKLAMLYPDGKHQILNEADGTWHEGVWYSNHSFKPRPYAAPMSPYGTDMYGDERDWGDM